ncbi:MAG: hypothetical protein AB2L14_19815 [Candidatus Xenobiia bacterium LiM19]
MINPLGTLQTRKNRIRSVIAATDESIAQCNLPELKDMWLRDEGDSQFPQILRGFLIDERTIRAVSLKIKMLLTLLMKAQELWMSRQEVRDMLPCPCGGWLSNTPMNWESTLFLRVEMAPFIYQDYIQPSVKFLSLRGDGVSPDFVSHRTIPERQLALWRHLGIDTTTCSSLDSMNFFREQLTPWVSSCRTGEEVGMSNSEPDFGLLFDENSSEAARRSLLELSSYLSVHGIETDLISIGSSPDIPSLKAVLNMVSAAGLASQSIQLPDALASLREKGRLFNLAPLPVFAQGIFELLTDPHLAEALGTPPQETVKRMIPWTRVIRDGEITTPAGSRAVLRDYAGGARQYLVIRPQWGGDSEQIISGADITQNEWIQALDDALNAPYHYVLQERVEYPQASLPFVEGDSVQWRKVLFTIDAFASSHGEIGGMAAQVFSLDDSVDGTVASSFSSPYCGTTSVMKADL